MQYLERIVSNKLTINQTNSKIVEIRFDNWFVELGSWIEWDELELKITWTWAMYSLTHLVHDIYVCEINIYKSK